MSQLQRPLLLRNKEFFTNALVELLCFLSLCIASLLTVSSEAFCFVEEILIRVEEEMAVPRQTISSKMIPTDCFHRKYVSSPCFIQGCNNIGVKLSTSCNSPSSVNFSKLRLSCPQRKFTFRTSSLEMKKEPTSKPPLNVPSGILLATSCVLAIAFVGSLFELSSVSMRKSIFCDTKYLQGTSSVWK